MTSLFVFVGAVQITRAMAISERYAATWKKGWVKKLQEESHRVTQQQQDCVVAEVRRRAEAEMALIRQLQPPHMVHELRRREVLLQLLDEIGAIEATTTPPNTATTTTPTTTTTTATPPDLELHGAARDSATASREPSHSGPAPPDVPVLENWLRALAPNKIVGKMPPLRIRMKAQRRAAKKLRAEHRAAALRTGG